MGRIFAQVGTDIRRGSVRHCKSWVRACARAVSAPLVVRHAVSLVRVPIGAAVVDFCRRSSGGHQFIDIAAQSSWYMGSEREKLHFMDGTLHVAS